MKHSDTVRVIGGGWYGCHLTRRLVENGYKVELWEKNRELFRGASGSNPARLHLGFHYPRSAETRHASQSHYRRFMEEYGGFTRGIPVNIYAVAAGDSLVDFANYKQTLRGEVDFIEIERPGEFGLACVAGAVLTGERHILVNKVREYFTSLLDPHIHHGEPPNDGMFTVDCTFCSLGREGVERYEPCIMWIFEGPYDKAVTIMDGPFPSFYPHYEEGHVSLTSAKYTPLSKRCKTSEEAHAILEDISYGEIKARKVEIVESMAIYYPDFQDIYTYVGESMAVRAMPLSGADSRLFNLVETENGLRLMAGKIDAIFDAADAVCLSLQA